MDTASFSNSFSSLFQSYMDPAETPTKPMDLTRPEMSRRSSSAAHNAFMRQLMAPWGASSSRPHQCRVVSFSSWRRFSRASTSSKSSEEMSASVLLQACGTTPDFDPPLLERCDLRVAEDVVCGNPETERTIQRSHARIQRKSRRSTSSRTTATRELGSQPVSSKTITFKKQVVKSMDTNSLLTASFKEPIPKARSSDPPKVALEKMGKQLGIEALSISDLPEDAFESDSEDED